MFSLSFFPQSQPSQMEIISQLLCSRVVSIHKYLKCIRAKFERNMSQNTQLFSHISVTLIDLTSGSSWYNGKK